MKQTRERKTQKKKPTLIGPPKPKPNDIQKNMWMFLSLCCSIELGTLGSSQECGIRKQTDKGFGREAEHTHIQQTFEGK